VTFVVPFVPFVSEIKEKLMKKILCYGDSNTWGYDPLTRDRFNREVRWPGVLRLSLGEGYEVIEEGLNGRTTVWEDPIEGYKNGLSYLIPCLESHRPLDLVIIMLGTNDMKMRFSLSAYDAAEGAGVLVRIVQKSEAGKDGSAPAVLLMAPPPFARLTGFADFFAGGEEKSRKFGEQYRRVAGELGCHFLDTATVIVSSELDGIHFEREEHARLGQEVAAAVKEIVYG
jgi:lysophospholipase L1-like esterase